MKNERQNAIASIISENDIEKQEDLITHLEMRGFHTAQATISRDLRQMNITKVNNGRGGFRYAMPSPHTESNLAEYAMAYATSVVSVDYSMNNVVIKTMNGLANAVAVGLDSIHVQSILGCVAGDDTIIVVTRTEDDARIITERIRKMKEMASHRT